MTDTQEQNQVSIISQYIKDMSLEVPNAPEIYTKITTQPQIGVELNIDVKKMENSMFEVVLNLRINADINNEKLFIFELAYGSLNIVKIPEENIIKIEK